MCYGWDMRLYGTMCLGQARMPPRTALECSSMDEAELEEIRADIARMQALPLPSRSIFPRDQLAGVF